MSVAAPGFSVAAQGLRSERSVQGFSKAFVERLGRIAGLAQGMVGAGKQSPEICRRIWHRLFAGCTARRKARPGNEDWGNQKRRGLPERLGHEAERDRMPA